MRQELNQVIKPQHSLEGECWSLITKEGIKVYNLIDKQGNIVLSTDFIQIAYRVQDLYDLAIQY